MLVFRTSLLRLIYTPFKWAWLNTSLKRLMYSGVYKKPILHSKNLFFFFTTSFYNSPNITFIIYYSIHLFIHFSFSFSLFLSNPHIWPKNPASTLQTTHLSLPLKLKQLAKKPNYPLHN